MAYNSEMLIGLTACARSPTVVSYGRLIASFIVKSDCAKILALKIANYIHRILKSRLNETNSDSKNLHTNKVG